MTTTVSATRAEIDQMVERYVTKAGGPAGNGDMQGAPPVSSIDRMIENAVVAKGKVQREDRLVINKAADLEMRGVDWLWHGRFARGKIALIAGLPDMGKGQIASFIAAAVTAAVALPCDEGTATQGNVIWFNAEDGAREPSCPGWSRQVPTPVASTSPMVPAWAVKTRCLASSPTCRYCERRSSESVTSFS